MPHQANTKETTETGHLSETPYSLQMAVILRSKTNGQDPGRAFSLSAGSRRRRFAVAGNLPRDRPGHRPPLRAHELAESFLRVANAKMVQAIHSISVAKGAIPAITCSSPSAGPPDSTPARWRANWAWDRFLFPDAGVFGAMGSAWPMSRAIAGRGLSPYTEAAVADLETTLVIGCSGEACTRSSQEGFARSRSRSAACMDLRYRGVDSCLTVRLPVAGTYAEAYAADHTRLYGYVHEGRAMEMVAAQVEVVAPPDPNRELEPSRRPAPPSEQSRPGSKPGRIRTAVFVAERCGQATRFAARPSSASRPRPRSSIRAGRAKC